MKKVTLFRADDYFNNMGDIVGFFSSKEEAESNLYFSEPSDQEGDGDFSQITEFKVDEISLKDIDISDTKRVLQDDIWGNSEIEKTYYFI